MSWKCLYLLSIVLLFYGCNAPKEEDALLSTPAVHIDLEAIKQRGTLTALVDNNSMSYFLYKGQPMGYDYELLQSLAKHLHVKLKLKLVSGVENAIKKLNAGEGDVLAFPLTITKQRLSYVRFTNTHFNSHQVLIQRKPDGWERMSASTISDSLIRNVSALAGKEIHVLKGSSFVSRLQNLSEEIGGEIKIIEDSAEAETEALIKRVALGELDYTVTDQTIAAVNLSYYPNLDATTVLSLPQQIAWAVRKNSPALQASINNWLVSIKRQSTFMVVYNRYFKSPRTSLLRAKSVYATINGNRLSIYDDLIKQYAKTLRWDWRLVASLIFQESRFQNSGQSWAGARGLMQLMPATAARFGAADPDNPTQNIKAGIRFLKSLDKYWSETVHDTTERVKFVLASYNVGLTHITDARKLAIRYEEDPSQWKVVEKYLLKKSEPSYYKAPEVMAGYCKCEEPVRYVEEVLTRYEEYVLHVK
jgi:membrane-bound lytic murein transglycosylase F